MFGAKCAPNELRCVCTAADPEASALAATPGRSGTGVVVAHNSQPDASVRKEAAPVSNDTVLCCHKPGLGTPGSLSNAKRVMGPALATGVGTYWQEAGAQGA